ncbi:hypothetical protein TNCV_2355151 [Trichonephila clavipes]|nr:hypothetical protein TNCV_2355151 [Trichonephila clavipes]
MLVAIVTNWRPNGCFWKLVEKFSDITIFNEGVIEEPEILMPRSPRVPPIVLYGSECSTIDKEEEEKLRTFEKKILQTILGAVRGNGIWRIRFNLELQLKYRENPT